MYPINIAHWKKYFHSAEAHRGNQRGGKYHENEPGYWQAVYAVIQKK